jgi:hypothetical protein
MTKKISPEQLVANKTNSKKGGVKTEKGKRVSSQNSRKHGLLSQKVLPHERKEFQGLIELLKEELNPDSVLECIVLERIALHVLQLNRISFAKNEFILACENPGKITKSILDLPSFDVVEIEPYEPKIQPKSVELLFNLYHRYEVSVENRLYKAIREYKK